ncbi:hypothetical protein [Streptomyces bacillaris]
MGAHRGVRLGGPDTHREVWAGPQAGQLACAAPTPAPWRTGALPRTPR